MVELDVVDLKDEIDEVKGLQEVPRPITRPELLAAEEGAVVALGEITADERTSVDSLVDSDRRAMERATEEQSGDAGGTAAG